MILSCFTLFIISHYGNFLELAETIYGYYYYSIFIFLTCLCASIFIGTSSLRRRAQLNKIYPHLTVEDIRGNLNTRLAKLESGTFDAILLATAGIIRMGWQDKITEVNNKQLQKKV